MYKTKKEIEKWIQSFDIEQVERLISDNYCDHINDEDLNICTLIPNYLFF